MLNRPEWKPWKSVVETFDNSLIPKTSQSPTRVRQYETSTLSQRRKSFSSYHDLVSEP